MVTAGRRSATGSFKLLLAAEVGVLLKKYIQPGTAVECCLNARGNFVWLEYQNWNVQTFLGNILITLIQFENKVKN